MPRVRVVQDGSDDCDTEVEAPGGSCVAADAGLEEEEEDPAHARLSRDKAKPQPRRNRSRTAIKPHVQPS